jgi:hypothetical protein
MTRIAWKHRLWAAATLLVSGYWAYCLYKAWNDEEVPIYVDLGY